MAKEFYTMEEKGLTIIPAITKSLMVIENQNKEATNEKE
jgi:hypothetical protein